MMDSIIYANSETRQGGYRNDLIYARSAGLDQAMRANRFCILVPLYVYPADVYNNATYNDLINLLKTYHTAKVVIILNPNSGPGLTTDANYTASIKRLRGAGAQVIGYVSTNYTNRSLESVKADIDTWITLYPGIQGIFLDEQTNDVSSEHVAYYAELYKYVQETKLLQLVVTNPGANQVEGYFATKCQDICIVHENNVWPLEADLKGDYAGGHMDYSYTNRGILVYGQPTLSSVDIQTAGKYVGAFYVTHDDLPNPWDTVSNHMEDLLKLASTNSSSGSGSYNAGNLIEISSNEIAVKHILINDAGGNENTFIGRNAGLLYSSGDHNVIIGAESADELITGSRNVLIGPAAACGGSYVTDNICIGFNAGKSQVTGNNLVARFVVNNEFQRNPNTHRPIIEADLTAGGSFFNIATGNFSILATAWTSGPSFSIDNYGNVQVYGNLNFASSLGEINLNGNSGTAGQVLTSNGVGNGVTWQTVSAGPGGSNGQVQYNNNGVLAGISGFTYDPTSGAISINPSSTNPGNTLIQSASAISGNTNGGGLTISTGASTGTGQPGSLTIQPGPAANNSGAPLNITGGVGSGPLTVGGNINMSAGTGPIGGTVTITGGPATSFAAQGGMVRLVGGSGSSQAYYGRVGLTSYNHTLDLWPDGRLEIDGQPGTSGQVLTSNGSGSAPTWMTPVAQLAAAYIGYGSGSNQLTGSSFFTYNQQSGAFSLNIREVLTPSGSMLHAASHSASGAGGSLTLSAGAGGPTSGVGGNLNLSAGNSRSSSAGGSVFITAGGSNVVGGYIAFSTGTNPVEQFRLMSTGAWSLGSSGGGYGTSGQVLTSNGAGSNPTWQSPTITAEPADYIVWGTGSGVDSTADFTFNNATKKVSQACSSSAYTDQYVLRAETSNNTQTEMLLANGARMAVQLDRTWHFEVHVAARAHLGNESAGYRFYGVIDNNTNTVALVGSVTETVDAEDVPAWNVVVDADAGTSSLRIRVTGENAKTIRWSAFVRVVVVV